MFKSFKKIVAILLALVMAIACFCGCDETSKTEPESKPKTKTIFDSVASAADIANFDSEIDLTLKLNAQDLNTNDLQAFGFIDETAISR